MSDNERKQLDAAAELLSELDKQLQREQKLLWLAYGMGLRTAPRRSRFSRRRDKERRRPEWPIRQWRSCWPATRRI